MRTLKDEKKESFNERTIVLQDFPSHFHQVGEIADMVSCFGAITSVEAPTLDSYVMAQLEEKGLMNDQYTKARQARKEQEYRHAQNVLKESMVANFRA